MQNNDPGKIVVFEGIGGSGKSTQINLAAEYLTSHLGSAHVSVYREPGGTQLGELLRPIMLEKNNNIHHRAIVYLFNTSRIQLIEEKIKPDLSSGKIVLLDRFYDSTDAYQATQGVDVSWTKQVNMHAVQEIRPDMTFHLRLPLEEALKRVHIRGADGDKFDMEKKDFQQRLFNEYERVSWENKHIVIDALGSESEVFNRITPYLCSLLRK